MDELSGLNEDFPLYELGNRRTELAEHAAEVCAIAERLLFALGHEWHAYNFEQADAVGVCFNVQYPGANKTTWVTTGALQFDGGTDDQLAEQLAAYWDREFRGVNPPSKKRG